MIRSLLRLLRFRYSLRFLFCATALTACATYLLREPDDPHEYTIAIGKGQADLLRLLGAPQRRSMWNGAQYWHYNYSWGELSAGFRNNGRCKYVGYRRVGVPTWQGVGLE